MTTGLFLPDEWDMLPAVREAATRVYVVLQKCALCPHPSMTFDGMNNTMLLAWRIGNLHFEVEIAPSGQLCWWAYDMSFRSTRMHGQGTELPDNFVNYMAWALLPQNVREVL